MISTVGDCEVSGESRRLTRTQRSQFAGRTPATAVLKTLTVGLTDIDFINTDFTNLSGQARAMLDAVGTTQRSLPFEAGSGDSSQRRTPSAIL